MLFLLKFSVNTKCYDFFWAHKFEWIISSSNTKKKMCLKKNWKFHEQDVMTSTCIRKIYKNMSDVLSFFYVSPVAMQFGRKNSRNHENSNCNYFFWHFITLAFNHYFILCFENRTTHSDHISTFCIHILLK